MAEKITINLHKPAGAGRERSTTVQTALELLPVGGSEGPKFRLAIADPRGSNRDELTFVAKGFDSDPSLKLPYLEAVARTYARFLALGYPVPRTARVFEHNGIPYLAMSDMTANGEYLIWGYNNDDTEAEAASLWAMDLSPAEVREVKSRVLQLADQATADYIAIGWATYHVRKHRRTGQIDVVLLDIHPWMLTERVKRDAESTNAIESKCFLNEFLQAVKRVKAG
jgi:hypothetical protein